MLWHKAQGAGGLVGGFSPISLFGAGDFGGFYDFSDTSTLFQNTAGTTPVTANGQSIFRVNDLSGNGNDLTAPSGAPTWNSSGYASFDGVNDYLRKAISRTLTDFTIIIGSEEISRQNNATYAFVSGMPAFGRLSAHLAWSDGNYYFDTYDFTLGRTAGAATVGVGVPLVASHSRSGSSVSVRTNGSSFGSASASNSISADQINLAYETSGYYNGKIFAFFFIDRALSASELQNVEDWIAAKNGAY